MKKSNEISSVSSLVFMAMYLALFFVLDWFSNQLPLFQMPNGGTLGLGVIPLILCSYHLGWKKGLGVGILSVVLQFMTGKIYLVQNSDGFSTGMILLQFLMEYPLAFGIYGLSSMFPNKGAFYSGTMITNLIRLALHTVAGTVFWATPWAGSFTYNASYMIPTMIVSMILVPVIDRRLEPLKKN